MRLNLGRAVVAMAAMAVAAPLMAHEPGAPAAQVAALPAAARSAATVVDAFHAALQRGDAQAAAAMLANDVLIFESGGVERSRAEYAEHHLPADADFSRAVSSIVTRRSGSSDGTTAWIASESHVTGAYKGRPIDAITTETMVLRRVGKEWKIVHIHWSSGAGS